MSKRFHEANVRQSLTYVSVRAREWIWLARNGVGIDCLRLRGGRRLSGGWPGWLRRRLRPTDLRQLGPRDCRLRRRLRVGLLRPKPLQVVAMGLEIWIESL